MADKQKCFNCGREFANLESHMLNQHGDEAVAEEVAEETVSVSPAELGIKPADTAIAFGWVVQTSHNTPNPDAPPPSFTPATTKEQH